MLKRKLLSLLVLVVFALSVAGIIIAPAGAIEEKRLDVSSFIQDGTTLVPMRAIFEELGATVNWDDATQTVDAVKGQTSIKLSIGSKTAYLNGQSFSLAAPAQITNGNTMVPLRFVSESLGAQVNWDSASNIVTINTSNKKITVPVQSKPISSSSASSSKSQVKPSTDSYSVTVYITRTGEKYHRAGCRYLSRSQIPVSLSTAKSQGYTPCSVCNPPR